MTTRRNPPAENLIERAAWKPLSGLLLAALLPILCGGCIVIPLTGLMTGTDYSEQVIEKGEGFFAGKIAVHPTPVASLDEALTRADAGPIPGEIMLLMGGLYIAAGIAVALWSKHDDRRRNRRRGRAKSDSMG